jgi:hypothetical protein
VVLKINKARGHRIVRIKIVVVIVVISDTRRSSALDECPGFTCKVLSRL